MLREPLLIFCNIYSDARVWTKALCVLGKCSALRFYICIPGCQGRAGPDSCCPSPSQGLFCPAAPNTRAKHSGPSLLSGVPPTQESWVWTMTAITFSGISEVFFNLSCPPFTYLQETQNRYRLKRLSFHSSFFLIDSNAGEWNLGRLMHAGRMFYHWATCPFLT